MGLTRKYSRRKANDKFMECTGSKMDETGKVVHCHYATRNMGEVVCPKCGEDLKGAY